MPVAASFVTRRCVPAVDPLDGEIAHQLDEIEQTVGGLGDRQSHGDDVLALMHQRGDLQRLHLAVDRAADRRRSDRFTVDEDFPAGASKAVDDQVETRGNVSTVKPMRYQTSIGYGRSGSAGS